MRQTAACLTFGGLILGALADAPDAAADGTTSALPAGLEQELSRREYQASRNARGLQAPNRAHGLRTYLESSGIRVHDRSAQGSPEPPAGLDTPRSTGELSLRALSDLQRPLVRPIRLVAERIAAFAQPQAPSGAGGG